MGHHPNAGRQWEPWTIGEWSAHLIVETTLLVQELEEFAVGFTSPEVQVTDLKVAPNFEMPPVSAAYGMRTVTYSDTDCKSPHHHLKGRT
jgi:hypothetical protein